MLARRSSAVTRISSTGAAGRPARPASTRRARRGTSDGTLVVSMARRAAAVSECALIVVNDAARGGRVGAPTRGRPALDARFGAAEVSRSPSLRVAARCSLGAPRQSWGTAAREPPVGPLAWSWGASGHPPTASSRRDLAARYRIENRPGSARWSSSGISRATSALKRWWNHTRRPRTAARGATGARASCRTGRRSGTGSSQRAARAAHVRRTLVHDVDRERRLRKLGERRGASPRCTRRNRRSPSSRSGASQPGQPSS